MYRILVADDEPIERTVISRMIQKRFSDQLEVVLAVNGREAVQLYKEKDCRIALLDIAMPGIDGLAAAEMIRKEDENGVIVFLTAFDEFDYAKKAFSVRALEYLLKPATEEELFATLEEAISLVEKRQTRVKVNQKTDTGYHYTDDVKLNAVADNIFGFIKTHYQNEMSLQDVAGYMNYSDAYFCKLFKQCFGKSFLAFLTEYRVEQAKKLLTDISINIKDVSISVGYQDSNYFTRVFKRIEGVTPTEYRLLMLQRINDLETSEV